MSKQACLSKGPTSAFGSAVSLVDLVFFKRLSVLHEPQRRKDIWSNCAALLSLVLAVSLGCQLTQKESLQFGTESADLVPRQTLVLEAHGTETTSVGCMHPHPSLFLLLLLRGTERDDKGRNLKGRGSQGLEVVSCVNERKD